ncbi:MAG: AsmA-like C-terminal region-containing protein [Algoriella sp.]|uniref:AsmA family protein n=1 Tax=Algoriella sp. TaxID=1872434 RepID=UPI002FCAEF28
MKKKKTVLSKLMKVLKITGFSLGGIALVLYVSPYFFKDQINDGIKEIAKDYVKTEIEFKDLDISFFNHFPKLTVTLTDSSIKGSAPYQTENLISAKEIALGVDVKTLFSHKIIFNELFIKNANINLKVDSLGKNNFDIMVPSDEVKKEEESSVGLALNDFEISNSNFLYDDKSSTTYLKLDQFDYDGLIDFTNNQLTLDADTEIKNANFSFDNQKYVKNLPLKGEINSKIDLNNLSFYFIENDLELGNFPFSLKGSLLMLNETKIFDLKIFSDKNDLKYIPVIIPEAYQEWAKDVEMEGSSEILFTMKGIMNAATNQNPDIHIEAKIEDGLLNYKKSSTPIKNINLVSTIDLQALDPDKMRVKVENLDFKLLDGSTKTNFTYWSGKTMFSEGVIKSTIDLEAMKNATGFRQFDAKGILDLEGNWKGSIVQNTKNPLQKIPTFYLKANLENGYFKMNEMPAALDHINLDMEMTNKDGNLKNTSILIRQIDAKALDNFILGKLEVKNLKNFPINADFKAKIKLQDIYKIYPIQNIDMRGDLFVQMKANGTYEPKRKKVPVSNSVVILRNGYIRLKDYSDLPLENITVETRIKSGRGSFNDLSIDILPIQFTMAGKPFMVNANLKNLTNLDYRIHSKGELNLADFYKLFPIEGLDIDGIIETNVGLKGNNGAALESLQNRGYVKIQNIKINTKFFPSKFVIKQGEFKFEGARLTFKDVKARYKRNVFVFDGDVSNYINYALKENEVLKGNINFTTNRVNIDDFMAFNSGESSSKSSAAEGVVLLPTNVELSIKGKAKEVLFKDIILQDFDGDLALNKGFLTLNQTKFEMIGSHFTMNGTYKPINARKANFSFDVKGKNFDIQRAYKELTLFREMASAAENAYGKVSLDYKLAGDLGADMFPKMKTIKGGGVLTLEDIKFKGFKLFNSVAEKTNTDALHDANVKKIDVKTSIENNVMKIERTKFKIAGFRPRVEGQVTLDGYMNVGMRLGLPPFGIIGIPIKVTGPSDTFEVEVGKYQKEDLDEKDDDFTDYQKSLEEEKLKQEAVQVKQ